ncbi:MAG: hypothetical protein JNJ55_03195 [Betaproteobacteria bacterium]|nr:hypothetical protein [Betaproteobacteria bacterium]
MNRTRRLISILVAILLLVALWMAWNWLAVDPLAPVTAIQKSPQNKSSPARGRTEVVTIGESGAANRRNNPSAGQPQEGENSRARQTPVEVCGSGLETSSSKNFGFPPSIALRIDNAWTKVSSELLSRGSSEERIGMHVVNGWRTGWSVNQTPGTWNPEVMSIAMADDTNAAVAIAVNGREAPAMWAAFSLCKASPQPSCKLLSHKAIGEADKSNAVTWLQLANVASANAVDIGVPFEEALRRAANAPRFEPIRSPVSAVMRSTAFRSLQADERQALALILTPMLSDSALMSYAYTIHAVCRAEDMLKPERKAWCLQMVERVEAGSRDPFDRYALIDVRRNLGESQDAIGKYHDHLDALRYFRRYAPENERFSCEALKRHENWASDVLTVGEYAALDRRFKESGMTAKEALAAQSALEKAVYEAFKAGR